MSELQDALRAELEETITTAWETRDGEVVPKSKDLSLGNDCVVIDAVMLYADLADSTELAVFDQEKAAEVFKCYLRGCTRLIKANDGEVRSFDGDRVMGVFIGNSKNTNAAKCGLQINWFFQSILAVRFKEFYGQTAFGGFSFTQTVGIDMSPVQIARGGIRNNNDLIWVGRAPNVAAKLSSIRDGKHSTFITETVYTALNATSRKGGNGLDIWTRLNWGAGTTYGTGTVYGSTWWWEP